MTDVAPPEDGSEGSVSRPNRIRLNDVMRQAEQQLWVSFAATSAAFSNSSIKGTGREGAVAKFLEDRLPVRFGVATGEVFDSQGRHTRQLDVIIYDRLNGAPLHTDETNALLPAEALLATIEVKSKLTEPEFGLALENADRVRRLRPNGKRFAEPRRRGDGLDGTIRCLTTVFAYQSSLTEIDWLEKEWQRMRDVSSEKGISLSSIDRLVVLDRGLINPASYSGIASSGEPRILRDWYLHLTNFLVREASRRQPFDWEPYGHDDAISGWQRLDGWEPPRDRSATPKRTTDAVAGSKRRTARAPRRPKRGTR
jgi:hypothetical protein